MTLRLLSKKKIITGCDSRGDGDSPYLTRWTLLDVRRKKAGVEQSVFAIYLHEFHRSDHDEMHDHPWWFVSLILWRGYVEETPCRECEDQGTWGFRERIRDRVEYFGGLPCAFCGATGRRRKRVRPGMLLFRPASHVHRVELVDGRSSWSILVRGSYTREWGFWTRFGWQRFREYFLERGC